MRRLVFVLLVIGLANQVALADLLLLSRDTQAVLAYDEVTGQYLRIFANGHGLANPEDLEFGPDGNVYIADRASDVILRFDGKTGAFIDIFVTSKAGGLSAARNLLFGPDGKLYVSSNSSNQVLVYNGTTGAFERVFATVTAPRGLAFQGGDLYVASESNIVLHYKGTGSFVGIFANDPAIQAPREIVFGPDGNLYLSSSDNDRVLRFNGTTGASMGVFANGGGLKFPRGLAFRPDGNLYVASANTDQVLRYNGTTGAFIDVFTSGGGASFPTGIAFTPAAAAPAPTFTAAGVTNGASFASGMSPGAIATIFGANLSTVQGVLSATTKPLPTHLLTTSVTVNGIAAPLFTVVNANGQEQINLQVPFEAAGQTSVPVVVTNGSSSSQPVQVTVSPAQPGIFTYGAGNAVAVHGLTNLLITAASPAAKGEIIVVYVTGLGPVTNPPTTGNPASSTTFSKTTFMRSATIGGKSALISFSGLAPTFVGLYQINLAVPPDAASGSDDLVITMNGVASSPAKIAVK